MKKLILVITYLLFTLLSIAANKEICENLYIWEFADENKQRTNITKLLTNEVEDALTSTACIVLQRRNYAQLSEQVDNETAIQSLENIAAPINKELQLIQAKVVLFGQVSQDFSGNLFLRISFENLTTKQILLSSALTLIGEEAYNISQRKKKIESFILNCVGVKVISNEETHFWQNTKILDTPEAYQTYLATYPNGKYTSEVKIIQSDEETWRTIKDTKKDKKKIPSLISYRNNNYVRHKKEAETMLHDLLWSLKRVSQYMQYFPEGKYATEDNIWRHNNNNNVDLYLKYYPTGKYRKEAEKALWKDVLFFNSTSAYIDNYLAHFPEHSEKVESFLWGQVTSASIKSFNARTYLKYFPKGKHAKLAQKEIK